ncbi:carbohydrate ABC transporter permease [Thermoflexus sp.]|uniref:carbohydrate ABC transporter permease n=1 Tax=Thermoflexus sp. TaxID=1969742 RepID=UPI0025ECE162|nr:sugar ABC transporter permease [Thermoflexus sp.]MDW8179959.1 sugar ABC transporter permease [Anaerolineae bacterium]MCS6962532.1 sugar ABC transporter permease [Thermoflexus sp.]MCS7350508.1 sugar ABC transporter permease [Thermoflexus sp.]MCX7690319.1 sugar ABC transporter permease [Thermoflexus sp.]MDW8183629.1 sugar ABC transporter permease [Anaerolineae bacterium]
MEVTIRARTNLHLLMAKSRTLRYRTRLVGLLMITPGLAMIVSLLFYPLFHSLVISLYDLNIRAPWLGPRFVGLWNYLQALSSPDVQAAAGRSLYLAAVGIGLGIPLSMAFALILNRPFPLRGLVRGLLIVPWILPGTVQGLLWSRIYDPHYGALNGVLYQLGIIRDYIPWLLDPQRALLLVALANTWATVPMMTLLYLAGLQSIPEEIYEAAQVDGAGWWARFRHITLPLLMPITLINLILKTIDALTLFDLVYVLTGGGPANATQVIGYYLYDAAFQRLEYGYASALAWLIALTAVGLTVLYSRITRPGEARL